MKTKANTYPLIETLQFLSIDVVLGSIAIGYMTTRILNVDTNPMWLLILGMAVWVVYSLDHIVDSTKKKDKAIIQRHRFHFIYQKPIIIAIIIIGSTTMVLSYIYLDPQIIIWGIILSMIICCYFIVLYLLKNNRLALLQKELIIALIYTSGITMASLYWFGSLPSFPVLIIIFSVFLLAWSEGIMNSWFDYDDDIIDGHNSFSIIVGKKNTRRFLVLVHMFIEIVVLLVLLTMTLSNIIIFSLLIILIMNLLLGLIILFPNSKISQNYHRVIGELVFILPGLIILI